MPLNWEVTKPSSESEPNFVFKNDDDEMGLFDKDNNCVLKLTIPVDAITAVAAILLSSLFFILVWVRFFCLIIFLSTCFLDLFFLFLPVIIFCLFIY